MEYKSIFKYEYKYNYIETFLYTFVSFLIPLLIGHPQIIVGIIVNSMLIMGALNLKGIKILPIIIAPSLGALTRGLLFGPFTMYLVFLIPVIWIGNFLLVLSFKKLKMNYFNKLMIGSITKSVFLFLIAFAMFKFGFIPVIFLTAMGIVQFGTALGGGALAFGLKFLRKPTD
jgi:hypothetical protein